MFRFLPLILAFLLMGFPPLGAAEGPLKKASFLPQWSPQAQFAGYYAAYEKGLYRKNGIDLTILRGGPQQPPGDFLAQRKADFVSLWLSSALQKRSRGVRLVNVGQVVQRSALMLVAKRSTGITTPAAMKGKKVGLWGGDFQIQPKAFFAKYDLTVQIVPQSFSVNLFLRGGVDVASAMWYNEYHTILNAGLNPEELVTFFFPDYDLNFPEDGIYALEETYKKDPELCRAFVQASLAGWQYAFSHPDEALDIVLRYTSQARIPANRMHQRWMLARMKDLIAPQANGAPSGVLQPADYGRVAGELKAGGFIPATPDYRSFFVRCDRAEK